MSDTFDLDAYIAEANKEPFRFRFGGEDYELPPDPDIRALLAVEDNRVEEAFEMLLGHDQWRRMKEGTGNLSVRAVQGLMNAYVAHTGATLGESSASTGSSPSTGRPSKPTSKRTTASTSRTSSGAV